MAHFAELDSNNVVTRVIVVANQDVLDSNGNEDESVGVEFLRDYLVKALIGSKPHIMELKEQDMQEEDLLMIQAEMYSFNHDHTHLGL